jgi:hypothetical protein
MAVQHLGACQRQPILLDREESATVFSTLLELVSSEDRCTFQKMLYEAVRSVSEWRLPRWSEQSRISQSAYHHSSKPLSAL